LIADDTLLEELLEERYLTDEERVRLSIGDEGEDLSRVGDGSEVLIRVLDLRREEREKR